MVVEPGGLEQEFELPGEKAATPIRQDSGKLSRHGTVKAGAQQAEMVRRRSSIAQNIIAVHASGSGAADEEVGSAAGRRGTK